MDLKPFLPEINPISRAEIQPQLRDAFANWLDIAEEPIFQMIDANAHLGSCLNVESDEPFGE
jgi:hypothetical protein